MAESKLFPILIPSRGRCSTAKTPALLNEAGVPYLLVVEPHEQADYAEFWGSVSVRSLPESHRGLTYARNTIFQFAKSEGYEWFWMLDDDITGFHQVVEGKCVRKPANEVLLAAQALFSLHPDVAQAALEYQQYAWSSKLPFAMNGYCDVAVCIHSQRLGRIRCRERVDVKLDRDLTLQILASGWSTMRCGWQAFSCPKNGSNEGGLHSVYATEGREAAASREMERLWGPGICQAITKSDGRPDVRINWKHFKSKAIMEAGQT